MHPWITTLAAILMLPPASLVLAATVPDDYASIQAALDAGESQIDVRPGTYAESLDIRGGVISLAGLGGQPVLAPPAGRDAIRVRARSFTQVRVEQFAITGGRYAVRTSKVDGVRLDHVALAGSLKGVQISAGGVTLVDSSVDGTARGAGVLVKGNDVRIVRTNVTDNAGDGIRITNVEGSFFGGPVIADCVVTGNTKDGIRLIDRLGAAISGNVASANGGSGIRVRRRPVAAASAPLTIEDNHADANGRVGIELRRDAADVYATPQDLIDAGNTATSNGIADVIVR